MRNLFLANLKLLMRNKQALFWTIAFPLIFIAIFGLFFGKNSSIAGSIVVVNQSSSELASGLASSLDSQSAFKVTKETTTDNISNEIKTGTATAALVIPAHFGDATADAPTSVKLIYDPSSSQSKAALEGFVNAYLTQANYQALKVQPVFSFTEEKANSQSSYSYFDFVLIGLIGMALMNSAIQGLAVAMAKYRDDQILKRITTTPLPGWKFIGAEVMSRLVLNAVQVGIILLVGMKGFGAHLNGSMPALIGLSLLGAILFQLMGFCIAAISKNTDAAEGMAQAIAVPMMFLSGVFFPIDQLPTWLYSVIKYLPLSPLLRSMRSVALEQGTFAENYASIGIIIAWIVLLLIVTIYRFRLSEE